MQLMPIDRLGAREVAPGRVHFGMLLPGVPRETGSLFVKVIHEHDQFLQHVQPREFPLAYAADPTYGGGYWSADVAVAPTGEGSAWGRPGQYVYRYAFRRDGGDEIDFVSDPFAREFGVGVISAFTLGYVDLDWEADPAIEAAWRVPDPRDLVFYELQLREFAGDLDRTIQLLDYLQDLGVNCLELMPVQNVPETVEWGYSTTGYFGVEQAFGNRKDFQRLVLEAHRRGIACVIDVVYGHVGSRFAYEYLYDRLGIADKPMTAVLPNRKFSPSTDLRKPFARDFFYTVNAFWLDRFHVDGFRYDCTPDLWDGDPMGQDYAELAYRTHQLVKSRRGERYWDRFFTDGRVTLVQCPEELDRPAEILERTYSTSTWQDRTRGAAVDALRSGGAAFDLERLGRALGLEGFCRERTVDGDVVRKSPLQYVSNHDHSRFLCELGTVPPERCEPARREPGFDLLQEGDRTLWPRLQPYLVGLFTSPGTPMLWQGDELCENQYVPGSGYGRIRIFRPVRWEYFYSDEGKRILALVRRLARLRRDGEQFRRGEHYFYAERQWLDRSVLLFNRTLGSTFTLVALNFGSVDQRIPFWFPASGDYLEELHGRDHAEGVVALQETKLTVPSNYGRVWTRR